MKADNKKNKPLYKYMARTWRAFSATTFLVRKIPVPVNNSGLKLLEVMRELFNNLKF